MSSVSCPSDIQKPHNLAPDPDIGLPKGLYAELWDTNATFRWTTLNTAFVQQLIKGSLSPDLYGRFMLQDLYYCLKAADDFLISIEKCRHKEDKHFMEQRYRDHLNYMGRLFSDWPIQDADALIPSSTIKDFYLYQHHIARHYDSIYFIISLTPCMSLWTWLGLILDQQVVAGNPYRRWVDLNQIVQAPFDFATHINNHSDRIDPGIAHEIFSTCMRYECNMFRTAGKQSPV